jgi:hypothetical protein
MYSRQKKLWNKTDYKSFASRWSLTHIKPAYELRSGKIQLNSTLYIRTEENAPAYFLSD